MHNNLNYFPESDIDSSGVLFSGLYKNEQMKIKHQNKTKTNGKKSKHQNETCVNYNIITDDIMHWLLQRAAVESLKEYCLGKLLLKVNIFIKCIYWLLTHPELLILKIEGTKPPFKLVALVIVSKWIDVENLFTINHGLLITAMLGCTITMVMVSMG